MQTIPNKPIVSFSPFGPLQIESVLNEGLMFDLFLASQHDQLYCLKTPSLSVHSATTGPFLSRATGIETSLWGGDTQQDMHTITASSDILSHLLLLESEKIRSSNGAWNHHVTSMGVWDGRGDEWKFKELLQSERFQPALLMPYHPGRTFSALSVERQRWLWPRMLPALWRALKEQPHGDLSPSNIILSLDESRFAMIDPGVLLWSSTMRDGGDSMYMDHGAILTCNAEYYPLFPPNYVGPSELGLHAHLQHHLRWFSWLVQHSAVGPLFVSSAQGAASSSKQRHSAIDAMFGVMQEKYPERIISPEDTRPSLPDLLAAGIIYYQILTGKHPIRVLCDASLSLENVDFPLWSGAFGEARRPLPLWNFVQEWEQIEFISPQELNPNVTVGESQLAIDLLHLRIPSMPYLLALTADAVGEG